MEVLRSNSSLEFRKNGWNLGSAPWEVQDLYLREDVIDLKLIN